MKTGTSACTLKTLAALFALATPLGLSGCIAVGYSSGGGWFIWPPVGLILIVVFIVFLLRRR